jgi:hypothetical protein
MLYPAYIICLTTKTGGSTTKGPENTNVFLNVHRGLSYDLTEKLSLQTTINILSLGLSYVTSNTGSVEENKTYFNIGAGLNNIASIGGIPVGAIYKF